MTISDLVARLGRLQKEIGNVAQIKIGKEYNQPSSAFDYFSIVVDGKDVVLVPSDVWDQEINNMKIRVLKKHNHQYFWNGRYNKDAAPEYAHGPKVMVNGKMVYYHLAKRMDRTAKE